MKTETKKIEETENFTKDQIIENLKKELEEKNLKLSSILIPIIKETRKNQVARIVFNLSENGTVKFSDVVKACIGEGYTNKSEIWYNLDFIRQYAITLNPSLIISIPKKSDI